MAEPQIVEGNGPFAPQLTTPVPDGPTIAVPVRAAGLQILDRYGNVVAACTFSQMAERLAFIINAHAGVS